MKKQRTELVFILDRSGSMAGLERDTIGGYNSLLAKQKKLTGKANVTTLLFDDHCDLLHDRLPLEEVLPITGREYYVRGSTALLDAIGFAITRLRQSVREEEQEPKVMVVITTDGYENASHEYSYERIRQMISERTDAGWEFLFLGANIDAVKEAGRFGIAPQRASSYINDDEGVSLNYMVMSNAVSSYRENSRIEEDWKAPIEEDEAKRGTKKSGGKKNGK